MSIAVLNKTLNNGVGINIRLTTGTKTSEESPLQLFFLWTTQFRRLRCCHFSDTLGSCP